MSCDDLVLEDILISLIILICQIDIIYKELLHLKALSHLSTMVKRELASVFVFESRPRACTVLFNQGNEGTSWYIILQGSVNVVIHNRVNP